MSNNNKFNILNDSEEELENNIEKKIENLSLSNNDKFIKTFSRKVDSKQSNINIPSSVYIDDNKINDDEWLTNDKKIKIKNNVRNYNNEKDNKNYNDKHKNNYNDRYKNNYNDKDNKNNYYDKNKNYNNKESIKDTNMLYKKSFDNNNLIIVNKEESTNKNSYSNMLGSKPVVNTNTIKVEKEQRWTTQITKKYDKLPENFDNRDLTNIYVIPIGKKTNRSIDSRDTEEYFIKTSQRRLYECSKVYDALLNCKDLALQYYNKFNNKIDGININDLNKLNELCKGLYDKKNNHINNNKLYSLDVLTLYMYCIYFHMLVKNDKNSHSQFMTNLSNQINNINLFNNIRKFIVNSIWNAYTPIQNAAFYLSSNCFEDLIIWGADINALNIDGEDVEKMITFGYNKKIQEDNKKGIDNVILHLSVKNQLENIIIKYRNNKVITNNDDNEVDYDINEIVKELENYQSYQIFDFYLEESNKKQYIMIIQYLNNIESNNNDLKINVFRDWFDRALGKSEMMKSARKYIELINKLYKDGYLNNEFIKLLFDDETLDYIKLEAPALLEEIKVLFF